jgi:hypothetical protein
MVGGTLSNRWLGLSPGVVALVATIGFGMPAYGQHVVHTSGGHVSAPHSLPHISAQRQSQPPQQIKTPPPQQQTVEPPREIDRGPSPIDRPPTGGGQSVGGQPVGGQPVGGQSSPGGQPGLSGGAVMTGRVPHPPTNRRWPLPQGATEADRPPPGQCRVWLNGVPGSRQPAPTSCGQAAKMRTPNSSLIFGDDGGRPQ